MFERYTEEARRSLFFARYETSQLGSATIETEHLLLGLLRASKGICRRFFESRQLSPHRISADIVVRAAREKKTSTSIEIPFSEETKRALHFAAAEADRMRTSYIGAEHLLLALLREEGTAAGLLLAANGLRLDDARKEIEILSGVQPGDVDSSAPAADAARHAAQIAAWNSVERIEGLVARLGDAHAGSTESGTLVAYIQAELETLKRSLLM
jgi:ATP-dependent Clp protease ATP-binding subunit ClpC